MLIEHFWNLLFQLMKHGTNSLQIFVWCSYCCLFKAQKDTSIWNLYTFLLWRVHVCQCVVTCAYTSISSEADRQMPFDAFSGFCLLLMGVLSMPQRRARRGQHIEYRKHKVPHHHEYSNMMHGDTTLSAPLALPCALYFTLSTVGQKVFSQPLIVQVLPLKKMREACNFHHRYTSTMTDKMRKKIQKITL